MGSPDPEPLGILAGAGVLPRLLAEACAAQARPVSLVGLGSAADEGLLEDFGGRRFRLGQAGAILRHLHVQGVRDIVLAGAIRRPAWADLVPDRRGMGLLRRLAMHPLGDDGLLRFLAGELELEGFRVVGAHEILPDLVMPAGLLAGPPPDAVARADIDHGMRVAAALGSVDVGQAVVVQQGLVLALEAVEGTDALMARAGGLKRGGPGPILVKRVKPAQDRRLDLPTLGPETVRLARAAGLRGIAVSAGGALILEAELATARADEAGLFLIGVAGEGS